MNNFILTNDWVFLSIVGPSGCGKTELLDVVAKNCEILSPL